MGEIRIIEKRFYGIGADGTELYYIEAAGLSTDTKPTTGIVTGSIFWERDASTGAWTAYMYEESSGKWTDREGNEG